jgi:uncharacterized membrane protein YhaH (DUF805 family)
MERKFCGNCGENLMSTMQFCPNCGSKSFSNYPVEGPQASTPSPQGVKISSAIGFGSQYTSAQNNAPFDRRALSLSEAVHNCLVKYFSVNGRASRSEYWWFFATWIVLYFLLTFLSSIFEQFWILAISFYIGVLVPSITSAIRRLHDVDRSGWWYLLIFLPLIGGIILLVWFCSEGTNGPNRFGPDPLQRSEEEVVKVRFS